jgi:hypothetical protein
MIKDFGSAEEFSARLGVHIVIQSKQQALIGAMIGKDSELVVI